MKRLEYHGPPIELWDGRKVIPGQFVELTEDQAAALVDRDPDAWRPAAPTTQEGE